ncbi:MAG: hypothetical protein K0V04_40470 [Deltaproteobacteria bacterium]|nr:hypothetical protein [Deltaproteobacteria bacterium]
MRLTRFASLSALLLVACPGSDDAPADTDPSMGTAGTGTTTNTTPGTSNDDTEGPITSADSTMGTGSETDDPPGTTEDPPVEAEVHWVGRYDASDPAAVRMGWSGSGFVIRFDGTGASVRMTDEADFFTVVIDGEVQQPPLATQDGEQVYPLAAGLPAGEHTIEVYRRTEGQWGITTIHDVMVDGELLPPPAVTRRIELIGDSLSNGYGNEGMDPCPFTTDTQNNYLTYGPIVAREVGAELHTISWSSKGVVYNYGDDMFEPVPQLYPRSVPADPSSTWDYAWQPDLVAISLGTNDFSTDNDPTQELFVSTYEQFMADVRSNYPDAFFLVLAPLLQGNEQNIVDGYIAEVIANRAAAGDTNMAYANINVPWIGVGCNQHPTVATHEAMAELFREQVQIHMGW